MDWLLAKTKKKENKNCEAKKAKERKQKKREINGWQLPQHELEIKQKGSTKNLWKRSTNNTYSIHTLGHMWNITLV